MMTPERLAQIRALCDSGQGSRVPNAAAVQRAWPRISAVTMLEVRELLAEVDRLRAADAETTRLLIRAQTEIDSLHAVAEAALPLMRDGWFGVEDVENDKDVERFYLAFLAWDKARERPPRPPARADAGEEVG